MKHISLGRVSSLFPPKAWGGKADKYKGLVSAPILLISNFHWLENCHKGLVCERGKWARLLFPYNQEELQSCQSQSVLATSYFSAHTPLKFLCPLHPQPSGLLTRYFHQEVTFIKLSLRVLPFHYGHFLCDVIPGIAVLQTRTITNTTRWYKYVWLILPKPLKGALLIVVFIRIHKGLYFCLNLDWMQKKYCPDLLLHSFTFLLPQLGV